MKEFTIGKRKIGGNNPVFIIAEMSGNHMQKLEHAFAIIDAAAEVGVDAVKIQTYTADTITLDSDKKYFQIQGGNKDWKGKTLYELYRQAFTPWEWISKMKERAEKKGLIFFSSVFDSTSVDFLEKLKMPVYKIASFEVVDIPLLKRVGKTGKPVIISKGMATKEELSLAVKTLKQSGTPAVAILQCVSSYPALPEEMNLKTIRDISLRFGAVSGLSDHTLGTTVSVASAAIGASIIEKHMTLSRTEGGPDSSFSLEPAEFKELVEKVRETSAAMGEPSYGPGRGEKDNVVFRKSLFVTENIKKGEKFTEKNVRSIRPGHGLQPKYYEKILGKRSTKDIEKGTPLDWKLIA